MECPHCNQELPALTCSTCGQKAIEGASFCQHCGHELPAPEGEEPKLLTCASCSHKALPGAKFCSECGHLLAAPAEEEVAEGFDPDKRVACSDGNCIGIIGPDGKCTDCGQPYSGPAG